MGFNKRLMSTASAGFEVGFTTLTQGSNLTVGVNNATEKYMVWTSSSRVVMCDTAALANRYSLQAYTFNGSTFTTSGSSLIFNHNWTHGRPITKNPTTNKLLVLNYFGSGNEFAEFTDSSPFGSGTTYSMSTTYTGGDYNDISYADIPGIGAYIYRMLGKTSVRKIDPTNYTSFTDITLPITLSSSYNNNNISLAYDGYGWWVTYYNSTTWYATKFAPDFSTVLVSEQVIYAGAPSTSRETGSCEFVAPNKLYVKSQFRNLLAQYTLS